MKKKEKQWLIIGGIVVVVILGYKLYSNQQCPQGYIMMCELRESQPFCECVWFELPPISCQCPDIYDYTCNPQDFEAQGFVYRDECGCILNMDKLGPCPVSYISSCNNAEITYKGDVCGQGITPICNAIGTRSEGWYCLDGTLVKYDSCEGCEAVEFPLPCMPIPVLYCSEI